MRRCEYIFYRGLYRTSYARVSRGIVTDTELQIGQFVVPRPGTTVTDDSREVRYLRSYKEMLPVDHVSGPRVSIVEDQAHDSCRAVVSNAVLPRVRGQERSSLSCVQHGT